MQPTPEIGSFISRIVALPPGPGVSLDAALQPSLDEEVELRKLFATDRQDERLANPHVGLVDVFDAPDVIRTTRARVVNGKDDLSAQYVMPLQVEDRRKEGTPSMVANLEEFRKNWAIFTEGSLSQLIDWNNVVAAGGSVLACLAPLEDAHKTSKRATRKFYHSNAYPTSDVDLFLWGLTAEQAEAKIKTIYEAVRDSVPWDVTCIRTKHTVSIHSQYPYRSVQIVLRLYQSPAEILAGFDIDAPCCAYDGERVWANPRAIVAMMRQCNTVDMTRRSPSYEIRLAKYCRRAYEVYVPDLKRGEVDPTIFERSIARMEGLARLLVLEKLADDGMRTAFLQGRRQLRGRPDPNTSYHYRRNRRRYKGDLKEEVGMGIEMNDYDVASLHIPYGPGWDARRIDKLIYQTDLGMNSTFNPKNKGRRLHRHPAFFGTVGECLEDCCEHCPQPIDDDEKKLQEEEDEMYIRGRIKFIEENPGRQTMTGSFNPIDVGEWSEQVYIKPTQQLFSAIATRDRTTVQRLLQDGIDVNQRDYVGRTTLHVAISAKATDIALDLIDAGARITARLADGRAPLHLAAQNDEPLIIQKLLQKSAHNSAEQEKKEEEGRDGQKEELKDGGVRLSSEDDWSSHDDEDVVISGPEDEDDEQEDDNDYDDDADDDDDESEDDEDDDDGENRRTKSKAQDAGTAAQDAGEIPEDEEKDQPDIIEIDALDWDLGFSALSYAIIYASLTTLDALIEGGADPTVPTKQTRNSDPLHPLTLTILREDEDEACKIAERLLKLPFVTSATADDQVRTIFHKAVAAGRTKLVETLLRNDFHATTVLDFPAVARQSIVTPVVTAIRNHHLAVLGILLAYGAKLDITEQDATTALDALSSDKKRQATSYGSIKNYLVLVHQPVEVAVNIADDITSLLVALGANVDLGLKRSLHHYTRPHDRRSLKDWFDFAINNITTAITSKVTEAENQALEEVAQQLKGAEAPQSATGWKAFHAQYLHNLERGNVPASHGAQVNQVKANQARALEQALDDLNDIKEFLLEIRDVLTTHNAKTWDVIYPTIESEARPGPRIEKYVRAPRNAKRTQDEGFGYIYLEKSPSYSYNRQFVPEHLVEKYDELYEACYAGDNDKIQYLCLPIGGQNATIGQGVPSPLNISVRQVDPSIGNWSAHGYTPLFAAISGRRWSTAKLILAIAAAQYSPDDKEDQIKFDVDVYLDEDSDEYDSDASEVTLERQEIKFVDIATRPSSVKSEVHPKIMLQQIQASWVKLPSDSHSPKNGYDNLLGHSVVEGDLEVFVQISNLYDTLPQPLDIRSSGTLRTILQHDQADILDEYIRRTGDCIDIEGVSKSGEKGDQEAEIPAAINDENRIYLGLNVHGKKRTDLANRNDPNASGAAPAVEHPLVWRAASDKAKSIVEYLASDRPLTAYKFYASTHSDARAIWFRRMLNGNGKSAGSVLEKKLPAWLGWVVNTFGESPITAAILSDNLDTIKLLARLQPGLTAQALQTKIKFAGANVLNLAIARGCKTNIIDYLLSRKVSPTERLTSQGWNIYHQICSRKDGDQLEHFLRKLPKDVNEVLLSQQSKVRLNTPLLIAVNTGCLRTVKTLLEYSTSTILALNVDGQTALHKAVERSYPEITKMLLAAAPPEAIFMEDCVGHTVLEGAILREIADRISAFNSRTNVTDAPELNPSEHNLSGKPFEVFLDNEKRVAELFSALQASGGKYRAKIIASAARWAAQRAPRVAAMKERKALRDKATKDYKEKWGLDEVEEEDKTDSADTAQTLQYLQEAAIAATAMGSKPARRLAHLFDVQQSVAATLSSVRGELGDSDEDEEEWRDSWRRNRLRKRPNAIEGELEEEESLEKKQKRASMAYNWLPTGPDTN